MFQLSMVSKGSLINSLSQLFGDTVVKQCQGIVAATSNTAAPPYGSFTRKVNMLLLKVTECDDIFRQIRWSWLTRIPFGPHMRPHPHTGVSAQCE